MANVIHRITKQYLKSVNTPEYPISEWIHNSILPTCIPKFWKIEGDIVREMTAAEKTELAYSTESNIYLIAEKQLLTSKNGHDYESDSNVIINPVMPACALKYTKVVDETVIEMTTEEKAVVNLPETTRLETKENLKLIYLDTIKQLQIIQNTTTPTTAQVIAAVKYLAKVDEYILKYIYHNLI